MGEFERYVREQLEVGFAAKFDKACEEELIVGGNTGEPMGIDVVPDPMWCAICGTPDWLNPTDAHEEWLGHPWTPRNVPGRVSLEEALALGL